MRNFFGLLNPKFPQCREILAKLEASSIVKQTFMTDRITFKQLPRGNHQEEHIYTQREVSISEIAALHIDTALCP